MTATVLTLPLFELDGTLAPGAVAGCRERCGRDRNDGQPCRAWPRRGADACAFHITAVELAVLEQLRARPNAAA